MSKVKKYYMRLTEEGFCLQRCFTRNSGLFIGSVGCNTLCKYCKSSGKDKQGAWIKCLKIKKAVLLHDVDKFGNLVN